MPSAGLTCAASRNWKRCPFQQGILCRRAAGFRQPGTICLHLLFVFQPVEGLVQYLSSTNVRRRDDAIVHPLAIATSFYNPRTPQIGKMPRYLRLRPAENLNEVADTNFLISNEVQEP